LTIIYSLYCWV